ncbi:hypothetical protein [Zhihengliuella salsuginis]|uniref:Uncharacterized protein n=1 Tax=Zhihengliuella salsuginis TaxID=578222 RepID=A0ABQ3GEY8_9MICC|nr:hypothetical protein [Zhihengliuella salsuginis]GHD01502.1 hypothetical protein GCM10008096_05690 [Zhihengliuella salsuginis]
MSAAPEQVPFQFGPGMRWVRRLFAVAGLLLAGWLVVWLGFGGRAGFVAGEPYGAPVVAGAWLGLSSVAVAAVAGLLFVQQIAIAILTRVDAGPVFTGFLGGRAHRGGRRHGPIPPSKKSSNQRVPGPPPQG